MSAIPKEFLNKAASLSDDATRPYPGSRKIYLQGSRSDVRVGMREVRQTPTRGATALEENPAIYIYDTSGPYTDPSARIDLMKGLAHHDAPVLGDRMALDAGPPWGARRRSAPRGPPPAAPGR